MLCLTVTLIIAVLYVFNIGEPFELKTIDLRYKLRGPREPDRNIEIIAMGDESIKILGKWPWPRKYHAFLIEILKSYKPSAICFDVLFTEKDASFPENDRNLARAAGDSGIAYFPFYFNIPRVITRSDFEELKKDVFISSKIKDRALAYEPSENDNLFSAVSIP